jgi:hypothetical protein
VTSGENSAGKTAKRSAWRTVAQDGGLSLIDELTHDKTTARAQKTFSSHVKMHSRNMPNQRRNSTSTSNNVRLIGFYFSTLRTQPQQS